VSAIHLKYAFHVPERGLINRDVLMRRSSGTGDTGEEGRKDTARRVDFRRVIGRCVLAEKKVRKRWKIYREGATVNFGGKY